MSVAPKDGYCLEVVFDNGNRVNIDFKSRLQTVRFSILSDKDRFKTVTIDGRYRLFTIRWMKFGKTEGTRFQRRSVLNPHIEIRMKCKNRLYLTERVMDVL